MNLPPSSLEPVKKSGGGKLRESGMPGEEKFTSQETINIADNMTPRRKDDRG